MNLSPRWAVPAVPVPASGATKRPVRLVSALLALALVVVLAPVWGSVERAAAATSCPCALWPDSTVPAVVDFDDTQAVELGTQFSTDQDGVVSGVRFYKSDANTGTHLGSLWTATGTLLARITFSGETANGWQQATFDPPTPVTAGTLYVISYHTVTGHYSVNPQYFTAGYDAGPLHAPAGPGVDNGLFAYSPIPTFPTGTFNGNNYWVSPVFSPALRSITVSPNPVSVPAGLTVQLTATGQYTDGSGRDLTSSVNWTASGSATVTAGGLVTGSTAGPATVTATQDGVSGSAAVTVTAPLLRSVTVSPNPVSVVAGVPQQLTATGMYSNGTTRDLTAGATWTSSNTARAAVSSSGVVDGRSAGSLTVSATLGGVTGTTAVKVRTVLEVGVSPGLVLTRIGRQVQLSATARLSDGTTANLTDAATWSSAVPLVATVSPTGLVTGRFLGATLIVAKVGGHSGVGSVNVLL